MTNTSHKCRSSIRLVPLLVMAALLTGCAISQDQEIQIGREARPQFEQEFGGLYPSQPLQDYVQQVGIEMARDTDRPDLPWEFRVLNSEQVNAFALPGGFIYVTRGMVERLDNEAQLASVLSHEIAHVTHRHSVQQLQRAQLVQGGAMLAGLFGGSTVGDVSQIAAGLALMQYSRGQEKEADLTGLDYMIREGYEPRATLNVMQMLEQTGGSPPQFLSSPPNPENRQEYLAERIDRVQERVISVGRTDADQYQQQLRRSNLSPGRPAGE